MLAVIAVTRSGSGSGVVRSLPPGFDCVSTCAEAFPSGSDLTFIPVAKPGLIFDGWSGGWDGNCCGTGNCSFTVAGPITAKAVFRCRNDFYSVGSTSTQDISDFLSEWFSDGSLGDFNGSDAGTVQDIFDCLAAQFAGAV